MHPTYRVLYVCTGNSARSILAEALTRHLSGGRFEAFSGGAHPRGEVHPLALELLRSNDLLTEGLRSKSWNEFAAPGAPPMDFVITVCDRAAGESCPVWPGRPITAQWSVPDPAAVGVSGNPVPLAASHFAADGTEGRIAGSVGPAHAPGRVPDCAYRYGGAVNGPASAPLLSIC
jgi:protein-tyrosine-phosphatase